MFLALKALNHDATLNNWSYIGSVKIIRGSDAKVILQLFQPDRRIRYIPNSGATLTIDFLRSDGTVLTKSASFPFADDRSILQVDLSDVETLTLIGQNIVAKLTEGTDISFAILQQGLQMISTTSNC